MCIRDRSRPGSSGVDPQLLPRHHAPLALPRTRGQRQRQRSARRRRLDQDVVRELTAATAGTRGRKCDSLPRVFYAYPPPIRHRPARTASGRPPPANAGRKGLARAFLPWSGEKIRIFPFRSRRKTLSSPPIFTKGCLTFQAEIIPIEPDTGNAETGTHNQHRIPLFSSLTSN